MFVRYPRAISYFEVAFVLDFLLEHWHLLDPSGKDLVVGFSDISPPWVSNWLSGNIFSNSYLGSSSSPTYLNGGITQDSIHRLLFSPSTKPLGNINPKGFA